MIDSQRDLADNDSVILDFFFKIKRMVLKKLGSRYNALTLNKIS
jgi:hypothetical protein